MKAVLYDAEITHRRRVEPQRAFTHRGYLWLVDLDELPKLPRWLAPFARFQARDHLGDPHGTIRANVDTWLAANDIDLTGGKVRMLAHARVAGYVFNPITLFWCHHRDGSLACVIAEVHNTYHQRHCYLLHPDPNGRATVAKELYVSPFLDQQGEYLMRVPEPDERLTISVALRREADTTLLATLHGSRVPASEFPRMLLRYPLMPHQVAALIRRHGIELWARRVPRKERPR